MQSLTALTKFTTTDETLSPASLSANWGKVYQNYISANLTSENLAKGAYDAYNLLSAGELHNFQKKSFETFNKLIHNQDILATNLSRTISNLDNFFTSQTNNESISVGTTVSALHKIFFSSNDSSSKFTYYDLSKTIRIPFAQEGDSPESSVPGLITGFSAGRLDKIIPLFNTQMSVGAITPLFLTDTFTETDIHNANYSQPIELLVWIINNLQWKIKAIYSAIHAIASGATSLGSIRVKSITFVDDSTPVLNYLPDEAGETYYIAPGQFQTTNK